MIRSVEPSDVDGVYSVERECFHDPYPRELLDYLMHDEHDRFFVAIGDEGIIGYSVATACGKHGRIVSVAVVQKYRRRGIGTALLSAVTHKLIRDGVRQIHLEVRKSNGGAIAFYERMGFRLSSEISRYYTDGEDAWTFKLAAESSASDNPRSALS